MFPFWRRSHAEPPPSPVPPPLEPIGRVRSTLTEQGGPFDATLEAEIELREDLAPALAGLAGFSHITVVFWMDRVAEEGRALRQLRPGGLPEMPLVGIFATRTQNRPNPIGVTVVELQAIQANCLRVRGLDALDGTPVLDVRPYLPPYDAVPAATMPPWVWGSAEPQG